MGRRRGSTAGQSVGRRVGDEARGGDCVPITIIVSADIDSCIMCRKGITDELIRAARRVASSVKGPDKKKTESDLLKMLKAHELDVEAARSGQPLQSLDLAKVIVGMRIEKTSLPQRTQSESEALLMSDRSSGSFRSPPSLHMRPEPRPRLSKPLQRLFTSGNEPLRIFDMTKKPARESQLLRTWRELQQEELKSLVTHPPTNGFEEMIMWTEQGKLWQYPIDNEDGLDEEKKVPFYEHVFTDHWMEGVPERGPVRQFMEVMAIALSKNPYITVQRKKQTFEWFKQYFEVKHDILVRSGALG